MDETERKKLTLRLEELKTEHSDLDALISRQIESGVFNQIQMQRLKKRKLILKDEINHLESLLLPDIIA